jgi:hypothetical protein
MIATGDPEAARGADPHPKVVLDPGISTFAQQRLVCITGYERPRRLTLGRAIRHRRNPIVPLPEGRGLGRYRRHPIAPPRHAVAAAVQICDHTLTSPFEQLTDAYADLATNGGDRAVPHRPHRYTAGAQHADAAPLTFLDTMSRSRTAPDAQEGANE